jgi:putative ABC transport system ATP-binding protein
VEAKPKDEIILKMENLTRTVAGVALVEGVSAAIHCGDVVSIFGPSGAGKSSLLRLINRLDEPTSGTVYIKGQDYRRLPPRTLRRMVGMVMQSPHLFRGTVADNLRFGPQQHGEHLPDDRIESLLERVGLAGYADRDVGNLSGGEAQRVSLARTLANSPEILLLDEPTSALDEKSEKEVEDLIKSIVHEECLTCLIVTHDVDQALRLTDRALLLEKGRLVRSGPVQEALNA